MNKLNKSLEEDNKKLVEQSINNQNISSDVNYDNYNPYQNNNQRKVYTPKKREIIKDSGIPNRKIKSKYEKAENRILYYMLHNKDITYKYEKTFPYLPTKKNRFLASEVMYFVKKYDTINISDFLNYLSDKKELVDLQKKK